MNKKELLELGFIDTSYVEEDIEFTEFRLTTKKHIIEVYGEDQVDICGIDYKDWLSVDNCKTIEDLKQLIRLFE